MTNTELTLDQLHAVAGGLLFADFDHFQPSMPHDTTPPSSELKGGLRRQHDGLDVADAPDR